MAKDRKSSTRLLLLAASIGVAAAIWLYTSLTLADPVDATSRALLLTGRLAFLVFLIPLLARPLRKLLQTPLTANFMRWRRNAGIVYGGLQVVHLLLITRLFQVSSGNPVDSATLIVGGLGIALVMGMLLTSFDRPAKAISAKSWKRLHKSGLYVCTFIYFYDFVIKPFEIGQAQAYLPFMILTILGLTVRLAAMVKSKQRPSLAARA